MIDTLTISKQLKAKGFNEDQAEVLTQLVAERGKDVVTSEDIKVIRNDVSTLKWMIGLMFALHAITIGGIIALLLQG